MKNLFQTIFLILVVSGFSSILAQKNSDKNLLPPPQTLIKRTNVKTEKRTFGAGGTVTILGAPNGSITIEGWNKNQFELTAEVEIQAANEEDLTTLSAVNGFILDESPNHINIITSGTHSKELVKRLGKKFPKRLLDLPWKIDFKLKVPATCDLEVNTGRGDFSLSGVEGAISIKSLESTNANLNLIGGTILATFGMGNVNVKIGTRSWRGRNAEIQLAIGTMNVEFPTIFNAEINASILRNGKIDNKYASLKPDEDQPFTDKTVFGKAGNGGATLSFTVGDGNLLLTSPK